MPPSRRQFLTNAGAGFGLIAALRGWTWSLYVQEALVLVFACVALIPMLRSSMSYPLRSFMQPP